MSRESSRNAHEVQQLLLANGELKARDELQQAELQQMREALVEIDRAIKRQNETITVSSSLLLTVLVLCSRIQARALV